MSHTVKNCERDSGDICTSHELLRSGSGGLELSLILPCLLLHPGQLSLQERERERERENKSVTVANEPWAHQGQVLSYIFLRVAYHYRPCEWVYVQLPNIFLYYTVNRAYVRM